MCFFLQILISWTTLVTINKYFSCVALMKVNVHLKTSRFCYPFIGRLNYIMMIQSVITYSYVVLLLYGLNYRQSNTTNLISISRRQPVLQDNEFWRMLFSYRLYFTFDINSSGSNYLIWEMRVFCYIYSLIHSWSSFFKITPCIVLKVEQAC